METFQMKAYDQEKHFKLVFGVGVGLEFKKY